MSRIKMLNLQTTKGHKFLNFAVAIVVSTLLNLGVTSTAHAGIEGLVKFVDPEAMSNMTSPAIIKDQSGGYMTGGSILIRGPRPKELQPFNVQSPSMKFDACTGSADFRFGGFSYISAPEFASFLKGVAKASGAYMVKMAVKTVCPQCEQIMSDLEAIARDINGMSMDQCAMAQSIAEGAFSKLRSSEKQKCMMAANVQKKATDITATTSQCQDHAGDAIDDSKEFEDMLGDEFNLVWKALSQGSKLAVSDADNTLKTLMMSVSGTIIGLKRGGKYQFSYKPSLLDDKELLDKYMGTSSGDSKLTLYSCNEKEKCLDPKEVEVTLKSNDTLYGNVSKLIRSLVIKVQDDNHNLSDEEKALISFSNIPIITLIELELTTKGDTDDLLVRMGEFIEVVCYDVITNFMQIMLNRVVAKVQILEHVSAEDVVIDRFIAGTDTVRRYLADAKHGAFQKLQVITQIKERLDMQRKEFEFGFGRIMKSMES